MAGNGPGRAGRASVHEPQLSVPVASWPSPTDGGDPQIDRGVAGIVHQRRLPLLRKFETERGDVASERPCVGEERHRSD